MDDAIYANLPLSPPWIQAHPWTFASFTVSVLATALLVSASGVASSPAPNDYSPASGALFGFGLTALATAIGMVVYRSLL